MTFSYSQSYDSAQTFLDDSESYLEIGFMKFAQMGSKNYRYDFQSYRCFYHNRLRWGGLSGPTPANPRQVTQSRTRKLWHRLYNVVIKQSRRSFYYLESYIQIFFPHCTWPHGRILSEERLTCCRN